MKLRQGWKTEKFKKEDSRDVLEPLLSNLEFKKFFSFLSDAKSGKLHF
jgi:hypothetical protein